MLKKWNILFVVVLLALVVVKPVEAKAHEDNLVSREVKEAVIISLNNIESHKDDFFGRTGLEFEKIQIGSCIYGYEYVENEYREIIKYFPLFYDNELIAFASSMDGIHYQLETKMAEDISDRDVRNCAFIYAADGCYLYEGVRYDLLKSYDSSFEDRMIFEGQIDNIEIKLCDLYHKEELGYVKMCKPRIQTYFCCNVPYVTQLPNMLICWAATTATISNYLNGTNYTAEQVAKEYYGEVNYNRTVKTSVLAGLLKNKYNLDYTYKSEHLKSSVIYNNIVNGYPIAGIFIYTQNNQEKGHVSTIYGVNIISGYIVVMDPSVGSVTAYGNGDDKYTYWNSLFAKVMELESGICHSWGG